MLTAEELVGYLNLKQSMHVLGQQLLSLNGFYSCVQKSNDCLCAVVDHIRSRPLFYATHQGNFYLSDNAEWVRQQVGDYEMDPIAREEFQLAGYVTGSDTLFPNVKQLQAGECLIATETENSVHVKTERYYRFLHSEPETYREPDLRDELDRVAVASIQRLIKYAGGRQIVVPLSGGYDSRLIVTLLKRLGYENILTFTYGVPGNKESVYSKRVADALGLRWHFVEYSEALWRQVWASEERWNYQKWASGWSAIAHVQDWLAVKVMKEQGVLKPDCVFAPGHSGDFVAGSHIPDNAFERASFNIDETIEAVFSNHYCLAPATLFKTDKKTWSERIHDRIERDVIETNWEYADAFEKWDWQERQSKFICNSVRVYEFFGYDWWLPLWDAEFVKFWERVPLSLRRGREWYLGYVKDQFSAQIKTEGAEKLANASDPVGLRKVVSRNTALSVLRPLRGLLGPIFRILIASKSRSSLGWEGWFAPKIYKRFIRLNVSINGMVASRFLADVSTRKPVDEGDF